MSSNDGMEAHTREAAQDAILSALQTHGPISPSEVAEFSGINDGWDVLLILNKLGHAGMIRSVYSDPRRCWLYEVSDVSQSVPK